MALDLNHCCLCLVQDVVLDGGGLITLARQGSARILSFTNGDTRCCALSSACSCATFLVRQQIANDLSCVAQIQHAEADGAESRIHGRRSHRHVGGSCRRRRLLSQRRLRWFVVLFLCSFSASELRYSGRFHQRCVPQQHVRARCFRWLLSDFSSGPVQGADTAGGAVMSVLGGFTRFTNCTFYNNKCRFVRSACKHLSAD